LTRTATLLALACFLIVGAAAMSVLARDSVPAIGSTMQLASVRGPIANRETKKDKEPVLLASLPQPEILPEQAFPELSEPLRQAFASDSPVNLAIPSISTPMAAAPSAVAPQPPKPKVAAKPPVQKTYALLSDAQIAAIKGRLNLSASQEYYWPGVETSLRAIARKIHASRQGHPATEAPQIDPDSPEVQQLKSAAMPLLFQLREDQKQEVRSLARIIGLHQVAAQI
jgi:hypothetical protein